MEGALPAVTTNQPNDPTPKLYAMAAELALQNAMPTTPVKGKRKVEAGPTPPKQPTPKLIKKTQEQEANSQAKGKNNSQKPTQTTNVANRKLFVSRTTSKPLADPEGQEAKIFLAVATVLTECEC